jgi:hypothetical protein
MGDMTCAVEVSSNVGESLLSIRIGYWVGGWWSELEPLTGG